MTDINPIIADRFTDHLDVFSKTMDQMDVIQEIANRCIVALNSGNKILFCGNGGSAADSQHLVFEVIGCFNNLRRFIASIELISDTYILNVVGNVHIYDEVFARRV